jgi:hypothetical protein
MKAKYIISVLLLLCILAGTAYSSIRESLVIPDPGDLQMLTLKDGSSMIGVITEVGQTTIKFETEMAILEVSIDRIREVKIIPASSMKDGVYWFPNPNQTRLFIGPTGRTLGAGEGYFMDIYVFFPSVAYGITKNISIGAGASLFPGVGFKNQLMYGSAKVGFGLGKYFNVAASGLIIRLPDWDDDDEDQDPSDTTDQSSQDFVGLAFAVATFGTGDASVTGGVGYGYNDKDVSDPAVLLGGEWRFSRRLALVTENWLFPSVDEPLISGGVRFMGEKLSVDLAFFTVLEEGAVTLPYIDFVWNF